MRTSLHLTQKLGGAVAQTEKKSQKGRKGARAEEKGSMTYSPGSENIGEGASDRSPK